MDSQAIELKDFNFCKIVLRESPTSLCTKGKTTEQERINLVKNIFADCELNLESRQNLFDVINQNTPAAFDLGMPDLAECLLQFFVKIQESLSPNDVKKLRDGLKIYFIERLQATLKN